MNKKLIIPLLLIFIPVIIFWQFFLKSLIPYSGNFQLAWYEPWKSDHYINGVINIAHKPIVEDAFKQVFPFSALSSEMIRNFSWPLWNPYNGAGMPLLATINLGLLDPHNLLYLILSPPFAWAFNVILPVIWISIFSYLYLRELSLNKFSSLSGSIFLLLSGIVVTRSLYVCYLSSFSVLFALLLISEKYLKNQKTKTILFIPILIFFSFISTQPQISLYILLFFFLYFIYRFYVEKKTKKNLLRPFLLTILGFILTSIQLIPTLFLFKNSNMTSNSSEFIFEKFLLPVKHLITIAIPNYFGNPSTYNFWGPGGDYVETVAYIGIIPLFFALLSFFTKGKLASLRNFFIVILFISLLIPIDSPFSKLFLATKLPLITTGNPARIFLITTFCIVVLAAIGFESFLHKKIERKKIYYSLIGFFIFFAGLFSYTFLFPPQETVCLKGIIQNCQTIALRNTIIEFFSFIVLSIFIIVYSLKSKAYFLIIPILMFFLVGFYNSQKLLPFSSKETFYPKNDLISEINKNVKENDRVFGLGEANISANFGTYFKFNDPTYYHPLYIRSYGELVSFANEKPILRSDVEINKDIKLPNDLSIKREKLFNLLGVNYLILKKSQTQDSKIENIIWQNDKWILIKNNNQGRVRLVNNYLQEKNKQVLERLFSKNFDPEKKVVIEEKINYRNGEGDLGSLRIVKDKGNSIEIEVESKGRNILVLADNYYLGWKAFVNDQEVKIYKANYTFKAIIVPNGSSTVLFKYDPWSFKLGLYLSVASLFIYLGVIVKSLIKKT